MRHYTMSNRGKFETVSGVVSMANCNRRLTDHAGCAHVAQLVEHVLGKDEVTRSIRVVGSTSLA